MPRLLVDSDAFWKLGSGDALSEFAAHLGIQPPDCARLPALPHQLERGRLHRKLGADRCMRLRVAAAAMRPAPAAPSRWMDLLVGVPDVDPGEAQLYALAAEHGAYVLTGDKRSVSAIRAVPEVASAVAHRVILPEPALFTLCLVKGEDWVRRAIQDVRELDQMLQVCFSDGCRSPGVSLSSYIRHDMTEFHPIALWTPPGWPDTQPPTLDATSPS